jgi:hypothetical protein
VVGRPAVAGILKASLCGPKSIREPPDLPLPAQARYQSTLKVPAAEEFETANIKLARYVLGV